MPCSRTQPSAAKEPIHLKLSNLSASFSYCFSIILYTIISQFKFAYWVILHDLLSLWCTSFETLRNTIRLSNKLGPDQNLLFVWLDLGSNCFRTLSAGD